MGETRSNPNAVGFARNQPCSAIDILGLLDYQFTRPDIVVDDSYFVGRSEKTWGHTPSSVSVAVKCGLSGYTDEKGIVQTCYQFLEFKVSEESAAYSRSRNFLIQRGVREEDADRRMQDIKRAEGQHQSDHAWWSDKVMKPLAQRFEVATIAARGGERYADVELCVAAFQREASDLVRELRVAVFAGGVVSSKKWDDPGYHGRKNNAPPAGYEERPLPEFMSDKERREWGLQ